MSKHSPDDIGYKQMFLINKFDKVIMENSLSKMREPKNISNESSNPIKNILKSSQTEEVINESKDYVNLIERKNKDENKMISSDQTKGNDLSEKGLTDVNNENNNRITSEDQTKKRKTPNKNKKILNIKSKKFEPVQSVKEKKLRSGRRYSQKTSFIESTPNKKKEIDVKDKEDDIYFHGWNIK